MLMFTFYTSKKFVCRVIWTWLIITLIATPSFQIFPWKYIFLQSMKIGKWINSIVYLREKCKNFLFSRTFNEQEIALILKSLMKIFKRNWPSFAVIDLRGQIHLPRTHSWYLRKYLKYILHVCTLIKNCNDFGIYTHMTVI